MINYLEGSVAASLRDLEDNRVSDAESHVPEVNTSVKLEGSAVVLEENSTKGISSLQDVSIRDGDASSLGNNHVALELAVIITIEDGVQTSTNGEFIFHFVVF